MDRVFGMDSKIFAFMSKLADLMILNIIFIITCLPIVTIGASLTALYSVTLKMAANEEAYIVRSYFLSFKENLRKSTMIGGILGSFGIMLLMDYRLFSNINTIFGQGVLCILYGVFLIWFVMLTFVFPLCAKFENTIKNTIKNALFIPIVNLPCTGAILIITFGPILSMNYIPKGYQYGIVLMILLGFSLIAYLNSLLLNQIFSKYVNQEREHKNE